MKSNIIRASSLFDRLEKSDRKVSFTFVDLFAGIGGTRIGFEQAGGECVFSCEWDRDSQRTYQANFGEIPHGDIKSIKSEDVPEFDVLVAGFPCQPFSSIGKRQGFMHATQGTLFYEILRLMKKDNKMHMPKAFLLENVPGLTTHDNGNTFKIILNSLDELGYHVYHQILDAANFGVPQHRKRIYIAGFRKDIFEEEDFKFPEANGKITYICDYVESNVSGYSISKHLQDVYLFKKNDGRPNIIDKNSKIQVKTLVSTYHKIQRLTGTFVRDGETGLRLLSENECKAIMGFPKDYLFPVSRTQMYRQLGNSVAIPVIAEIAKEIKKKLESHHGFKSVNQEDASLKNYFMSSI